nr:RteC domain-containing protein [uncultured Flavobacterium sp.]
MKSKTNQLLTDLNEQLNYINLEIDDTLIRCEKAIEIIIKSINKLKIVFLNENCKSLEHEIEFFKNVKPKFTSKLIYYNIIYKIEARLPNGGEKVVKDYIKNELDKIKNYFFNNHEFNKYRRTGSNYLDNKYYVRGAVDIKLAIDSFYFEADQNFATSHDFKLAKIMAHDLVQVYLEDKLRTIEYKALKEKSQLNHNTKLTWTASKVALIELLYALQSEGAFNNGRADLKEIMDHFERTFNIDLGQYRRTFLEIRARKSERTKFINALKVTLKKRMDDSDEAM